MSKRLTRDDWIAHGFDVLRDQGHEALKADKMVKAFGVSRGSFYWHFDNIDAFYEALLFLWRKRQIEQMLAFLKGMPLEASQLHLFIQQVFGGDHSTEVNMRRWAGVHSDVAKTIAEIDRLRVRYLQHLFMRSGISEKGAEARAHYLCAAYIGMAVNTAIGENRKPEWAADLAKMLLKPE